MNVLIEDIDRYYSQKLSEFGATARGVDWNSDESQQLRFEKLSGLFEQATGSFSILDFGCGFGSMYSFMQKKFGSFDYTGYDISSAMISQARQVNPSGNANWVEIFPFGKQFDFVVASGVFNVRLNHSDGEWMDYMRQTLHQLNDASVKGFAFNVLSSYSDPGKRKDYLFYADPCYWFDHCKKQFSSSVALLHDYPLYEFTILVRK